MSRLENRQRELSLTPFCSIQTSDNLMRPTHLGRAMCFVQSTDANVNLIWRNALPDTPPCNVRPNVWLLRPRQVDTELTLTSRACLHSTGLRTERPRPANPHGGCWVTPSKQLCRTPLGSSELRDNLAQFLKAVS